MFIHYRTQGLILKKTDKGEADQLFTIYTKDFGKLEILGRAIRKIKSKLRSGADTFYLSEIEFIQGKTCKTLTDTVLVKKFNNLRKDLKRLKIAYQASDIFNVLVRGQERDENIWNLLLETFSNLDNYKLPVCQHLERKQVAGRQTTNYKLLYYYLLWKLFSFLGYQPQLYNCINCQKKLTPNNLYFNFQEGGIICQYCFNKIKEGKIISPEIVKILRFISENNLLQVKKLKIESEHLKDIKNISNQYLAFIPKLAIPQT